MFKFSYLKQAWKLKIYFQFIKALIFIWTNIITSVIWIILFFDQKNYYFIDFLKFTDIFREKKKIQFVVYTFVWVYLFEKGKYLHDITIWSATYSSTLLTFEVQLYDSYNIIRLECFSYD